jgi:sarcosine oxidase, subunit beta
LPSRADVVVVGGGCMGTSIAFHLARRNDEVVLIEERHIASGATGHSGALVRQHYEARIGIRLARQSLAFFGRFKKETGFDCDFRTTGFLSGTRKRDVPAFNGLLDLLRSEGVRCERLSPSEAMALEPQLVASDYAAVVYDPDAGYADPIATSVGFAAAAAADGAKVFEGRMATSIEARAGRVRGVKIRGERFLSCERIVVAAGNWTPRLVAPHGPRLPIRYVRGDVAILRRPRDFGQPPKIHFDFYGNTYSRPEGDKDTLCGFMDTDPRKTTRNFGLVETVSAAAVQDLQTRLAKRFPRMARAQPRGGWAGAYDVTPDAYPILDRFGPDGLFVAAGFSGHGFKLSPEVGRLLAEFVATGRRPESLEGLRATRFDEGLRIRSDAPFPARRRGRLP